VNFNNSELHLFIIWENARGFQDRILEDISDNVQIIEVIEMVWSDKNYSSNLTRFYGQKLPDKSFKEKHCGKGPFLLVLCRDEVPRYEERDTVSRNIERVNTKMFDLKQRYRGWTGGGHKVHATNSPKETEHDLALLLGINYQDYEQKNYITWDGKIERVARDLSGADGWTSASELFYILNACERYVVLRNFEELPEQATLNGHDDIDFLVMDYSNFVFLLNGRKVFNKSYRVHYSIVIKGVEVLCDVRYVGDNYFDRCWQEDILKKRVLYNQFYVPDTEDLKYSVLYHALIHKSLIAEDYKVKLRHWFLNTELKSLRNYLALYMDEKRYKYTEPTDLSVYFNRKEVSFRRMVFYKVLKVKKIIRTLANA
jgi:hypothetical protein